VLRRNQFGVFVSGPVLFPKIYNGKDRTFWSFETLRPAETREVVQEAFWFPESFRRGDFSSLLTPPLNAAGVPIRQPTIIFDPTTGEPFRDSSGRITNIIPPSRIGEPAQDFINRFLPLPMFAPGRSARHQRARVGAERDQQQPDDVPHRPHAELEGQGVCAVHYGPRQLEERVY
jgi:hypothetical protein